MNIDSEIKRINKELASSDIEIIRVIEDIIDVMKTTGILKKEFLSKSVWDKLSERQRLRKKLASLQMLRLQDRREKRHLTELMSLENERVLSELKSE